MLRLYVLHADNAVMSRTLLCVTRRYIRVMNRRFLRTTYHPHALVRMRQRKVSRRQVERCVHSPHREGPSKTHPGNIQAEYDTESSTLFVWYEPLGEGRIEIKSVLRRSK